jgi:uncharacterized membrane protein YozB (DUF420 family)
VTVWPAWFGFPEVNASLNGLSAILILLGYAAVKRGLLTIHKCLMVAALVVSAMFLGCYLYYHIVVRQGESTKFRYQCPDAPDWLEVTYYTILISHIILAVVTVPLALYTAYLGFQDRLRRHRSLAQWTLPVWLYVSVTGVVVYLMLYRLYPTS